jgi:uncharacterized protein YaeQ
VALKSTIYKASLSVSDMDRQVYGTYPLTIARHPSETDERMMVRVLAFALFAHDRLEFGKGISNDDEPALWRKDLTDAIDEWIDVGTPDERALRKAAGRANDVTLLTYGGKSADVWWQQNAEACARIANLAVIDVPFEVSRALAKMANRNMTLSATIQDGTIFMADETTSEQFELKPRQSRQSLR